MKSIKRWEQIEDRYISMMYQTDEGWRGMECGGDVPDEHHLKNFSVHATGANDLEVLVLDNYGDELIMPEMMDRLIPGYRGRLMTAAIDMNTGQIYHAMFSREKKDKKRVYALSLVKPEPLLVVPASYLERLDQLSTKKRPFSWGIDTTALISHAEGYYGWEQLQKALNITLDFDEEDVLVSGGMWRTMEAWHDTERE